LVHSRWKLILLGLIASFGVAWLIDLLVPVPQTGLGIYYVSLFITLFLAFTVGGLVAQREFVIPAAVTQLLLVGSIVIHTAYLAKNAGLPVQPILTNNLPVIVISVIGAAVGARTGMMLRASRSRGPDAVA
jgi:hypothetical protein